MALIQYGSSNGANTSMDHFRREVNGLFDDIVGRGQGSGVLGSEWTPAADISEEQDRSVIRADLPGVNPQDVRLTLENGVLTIAGERTIEKKEDKGTYHHLERSRD